MQSKSAAQQQKNGQETANAPHMDLQIGVKLKHARLMRGMLLRNVAAKADCLESLISKVENGHANPSINTPHRITNVLGINIGQLFANADERPDIVHRKGERPIITEATGTYRTKARKSGTPLKASPKSLLTVPHSWLR